MTSSHKCCSFLLVQVVYMEIQVSAFTSVVMQSTLIFILPSIVGLICAAQHQNIWYRAQVIHAEEDSSEITIKFVDYGGYSTVPISTIKQIRSESLIVFVTIVKC